MGWLDDLLSWLSGGKGLEVISDPAAIPESVMPAPIDATTTTTDKKPWSFLQWTALLLGTAAFAPVAYAAYSNYGRGKKRKKDVTQDPVFLALEGGSNRATTLLAGLAPAFALPVAYIGVEELEQRQIISGPLGDRVQTLIAAGAVAPAVGGVMGSIFSRILGKGK